MKDLLGGKGANLSEMTRMGIPVPPGFTITTEVCKYYLNNNKRHPKGLAKQVRESIIEIEKKTGKKFGSTDNPLLFSVRSGAKISMPGMMDTVLNLGLNDETLQGLIKQTNNERFGWDAYRRFINMFGNVVMGVDHEYFEEKLDEIKKKKGVKLDIELGVEELKEVVKEYKKVIQEHTGSEFPTSVLEQLEQAIEAVFDSWDNDRAKAYRRLNNIPDDLGTAVNVQAMVFGNMGERSGTGVAFTRNPSTGEKKFYGEYLINAQGEDVVAGIRTPLEISELKKDMPEIYNQLEEIYKKLEKHYKDMQDIEFTIERGTLYLLQTRNGKRTSAAAVKIAVDMVKEKLIDKETAVLRIDPEQLNQLLHKQIDTSEKLNILAKGLPASPGAAVGKVVFNADDAVEWSERGEKVILVRTETSPEDIEGMAVAQGILTARGGMTSHAAVVARGMGICCIAGCGDITVDYKDKKFTVGDITVKEGDEISLNGTTGEVILGTAKTIEPELKGEFKTIMEWADEFRTLGVRTNADNPRDSKVARGFGAEGIGLCRTEHMFFEGERIKAMREMILSDSKEDREKALAKLLPYQKEDFAGIYEVMDNLPVTIRLLDPPLHEFLPTGDKEIGELAKEMGISIEKLKERIDSLHEVNPMLGFRGVRLAIVYPEIAEMQTRAIIEAAIETKAKGINPKPEIMIPVVGHVKEMKTLRELVVRVADEILENSKEKIEYTVGVMMELPRACLTADEIAQHADFFSFGTNDLTQTTFGYSRDDAGKFIKEYMERGILEVDPFAVLDQTGVGQLVRIGVEKGRSVKENLKVGICGEHGGEPRSVEFCHKTGLSYVSCSPYRVPIARLAAAQAKIKEGMN